MKLLAVGMSVLLSVLTARAGNVWYVDAACYEAETQDGSDAHPYGSIQRAIDAEATVAGDTILVRPGVYSNGVCTVAEAAADDLEGNIVLPKIKGFKATVVREPAVEGAVTFRADYEKRGLLILFR